MLRTVFNQVRFCIALGEAPLEETIKTVGFFRPTSRVEHPGFVLGVARESPNATAAVLLTLLQLRTRI
jgi:hypothetical protein